MKFTLTEQHIKLLKNSYTSWCHDEFGAPTVDPKRPYGNSDVYRDIGEILGIEPEARDLYDEPTYSPEQIKVMTLIHIQTKTALECILRTLDIEPGEYESEDYSSNWRRINDSKS